jgi:chromosome segregation ATPase
MHRAAELSQQLSQQAGGTEAEMRAMEGDLKAMHADLVRTKGKRDELRTELEQAHGKCGHKELEARLAAEEFNRRLKQDRAEMEGVQRELMSAREGLAKGRDLHRIEADTLQQYIRRLEGELESSQAACGHMRKAVEDAQGSLHKARAEAEAEAEGGSRSLERHKSAHAAEVQLWETKVEGLKTELAAAEAAHSSTRVGAEESHAWLARSKEEMGLDLERVRRELARETLSAGKKQQEQRAEMEEAMQALVRSEALSQSSQQLAGELQADLDHCQREWADGERQLEAEVTRLTHALTHARSDIAAAESCTAEATMGRAAAVVEAKAGAARESVLAEELKTAKADLQSVAKAKEASKADLQAQVAEGLKALQVALAKAEEARQKITQLEHESKKASEAVALATKSSADWEAAARDAESAQTDAESAQRDAESAHMAVKLERDRMQRELGQWETELTTISARSRCLEDRLIEGESERKRAGWAAEEMERIIQRLRSDLEKGTVELSHVQSALVETKASAAAEMSELRAKLASALADTKDGEAKMDALKIRMENAIAETKAGKATAAAEVHELKSKHEAAAGVAKNERETILSDLHNLARRDQYVSAVRERLEQDLQEAEARVEALEEEIDGINSESEAAKQLRRTERLEEDERCRRLREECDRVRANLSAQTGEMSEKDAARGTMRATLEDTHSQHNTALTQLRQGHLADMAKAQSAALEEAAAAAKALQASEAQAADLRRQLKTAKLEGEDLALLLDQSQAAKCADAELAYARLAAAVAESEGRGEELRKAKERLQAEEEGGANKGAELENLRRLAEGVYNIQTKMKSDLKEK